MISNQYLQIKKILLVYKSSLSKPGLHSSYNFRLELNTIFIKQHVFSTLYHLPPFHVSP